MRNVKVLNALILIIAFKTSITVLANCTYPIDNKVPSQVQIIENGTCIDNQQQLNVSATVVLTLRCVGRQPTRWILDMSREQREKEEGEISGWKIENERIGDVFVSDLVLYSGIDMFLGEGREERNISCLSTNITSPISRSNLLKVRTGSSCVSLIMYLTPDDAPALVNVSIIKNTGMKSCFQGDFLDNSPANCSKQFTVDLKAKNAVCEAADKKQGNIQKFPCRDLWSCELRSILKIDMHKCRGNFSNLNETIGTKSLPILNNLTHMVLACSDTLKDVVWPSAVFLYRGFYESVSWTKFRHYESKEEALQNAIRLPGLSGEDVELSLNSTLYMHMRTEFAENETVELACIAIDSLIVKGVRWQIGYHDGQKKSIRTAENQTYHVDNPLNLMIVKRNFTFGRNISWISCEGPVWNADKWARDNLTVKVTNGIAPTVNLTTTATNITTDDQILLTCVYGGWPRPTVTWNTEPSVQVHLMKNVTSHQPKDKIHEHRRNKVWFQTIVVTRSDSTFNVICIVDNKVGPGKRDLIEIKPKDSAVKTWIWILIVIVLGTLLISVPIIYWRVKRKLLFYTKRSCLTAEEINEFYSGASKSSTSLEALLLPYNSEYEISHDKLNLEDVVLGAGQFGVVLKGSIGSTPVAVKTVTPTADILYFKSILSELKILQFVGSHQNIVNLIGANTDNLKGREVFLVLDYCSNGNLVNFLRVCRDRFINVYSTQDEQEAKMWPLYENSTAITLNTGNLIQFAYEIGRAMDHIAAKNVIHGDLAARNVLVTHDLHAKICDFGLSKQLRHYSVYVQKVEKCFGIDGNTCPLPLRWMAIESLQDMEFSVASDKWSYGVCLWEIFSLAEIPYPGVQWSFDSYKMLVEGYRMEKPRYSNDSIYRLMLKCWQAQPQDRPSFEYIVTELKKEEEMLT